MKWLLALLSKKLCFHKWEDKCTCGDQYKAFCASRSKYGDCFTHYTSQPNHPCDYYYKQCQKCGQEVYKWNQ